MRQWAGAVDITPDTSPIMGLTPGAKTSSTADGVPGNFLQGHPAGGDTMAHTIVNDAPHPLIRAFDLARFEQGALITTSAASGVAHWVY